MSARPVEIHIEQLVLEGLPEGAAHAIASGLERALVDAFSAHPGAARLGGSVSLGRVDGGEVRMAPETTVDGIAGAVARAVLGAGGA